MAKRGIFNARFVVGIATAALIGSFALVRVMSSDNPVAATLSPSPSSSKSDAIQTLSGQSTQLDPGATHAPSSAPSAGNTPPGLTPPGGPKLECAPGKNGGATDRGVTSDRISLATTTVESGVAAAFLGDVKLAMEAIRNKVNHSGGICGRLLDIEYIDDSWDAQRGANILRDFLREGPFAIPVVPSNRGLAIVINSGDVALSKVPIVGTGGLIRAEYTQDWVWPVAASTATSARIMVRNAYARGARKFSIVFDKNYSYGPEAADAYNGEVRRLTGEDVEGYNADMACEASYCGILAGQATYAGPAKQFKPAEFVALFLDPGTALAWMGTPTTRKPNEVKYGIGGPQPLFSRDFATNCQSDCDGMWVWTGFKPPVGVYAKDPDVVEMVEDLKKTRPGIDTSNIFTIGGYVGMKVLVSALEAVGPNLTRDRLREALNDANYSTGLTIQDSLHWTIKDRSANTTMQAFEIDYSGAFKGWEPRDKQSGEPV